MTQVVTMVDEETSSMPDSYRPVYYPVRSRPVDVSNHHDGHIFLARPLFGPLLFNNTDSDARDHCAAERTFLSWLRLSIFMAIVSVAITVSFHLKHQASRKEKRMAVPLGILFWFLALTCLTVGFSNYIRTVARYSRRQALVQSGWKTQMVFTVVACAIIAACILFLSTSVEQNR